jgi:hypothetical protein
MYQSTHEGNLSEGKKICEIKSASLKRRELFSDEIIQEYNIKTHPYK